MNFFVIEVPETKPKGRGNEKVKKPNLWSIGHEEEGKVELFGEGLDTQVNSENANLIKPIKTNLVRHIFNSYIVFMHNWKLETIESDFNYEENLLLFSLSSFQGI